MKISRRSFLASAPGAVAARHSVAGAQKAGSIMDVEHVVILMQENRSFDHYFGALRGVRGFGDARPVTLPSGRPVWAQRRADRDGGALAWPFRLDYTATNASCYTGLDHSWKDSQTRWRNWDCWAEQKGALTMAHLTRADIPYYYALADEFTIADGYHCSLQGPTGPNRLFHFTGTSGLSVGHAGEQCVTNGGCDPNPGADMARDDDSDGLPWRTYAGRLEEAGVSWRVYQELANYSDNPLAYFREFRKLDRASSHFRRGRATVDWIDGVAPLDPEKTEAKHLIAAFAADVAADRLPAVSWIVPMMQMSEHPDAPVPYGEVLIASLVAALAANPRVWAKTAFILNYDENDGFFDHVPAPMPATEPRWGASNVDVRSEIYRGEPVGLGPRVPMMVISPWTRGGWVNSQLFDHTSVLRFLEQRFGIAEPNISPWRRAVCGDLTSMFDFDVPAHRRRDTSWVQRLPSVSDYAATTARLCAMAPAPAIATAERAPQQEAGTRPARALPYRIDITPRWAGETLALTFVNDGPVAVVFGVQDEASFAGWRYFTVAARSRLTEQWTLPRDRPHAMVVRGPNGFQRDYRGPAGGAHVEASVAWRPDGSGGMLRLQQRGGETLAVSGACAHGGTALTGELAPDGDLLLAVELAAHRWYDLVVTAGTTSFRLAGHVETGAPGVSEPAPTTPHRV